MNTVDLDALRFDERGLIPVIVQDKNFNGDGELDEGQSFQRTPTQDYLGNVYLSGGMAWNVWGGVQVSWRPWMVMSASVNCCTES